MQSINDIPAGLRVPAQIPLDGKSYFASQSVLANLGPSNNLAFTYFKGMIAYCAQEQTRWEWREPNYSGEAGLLSSAFVYPSNLTIFGIDYSGKSYNFFPVTFTTSQTTPEQILNSLEMSFDWKRGNITDTSKTPQDLPEGVTDNVYVRKGFIGFKKPIEQAGQVVHPQIFDGISTYNDPVLFEALVSNLGVKIKDFSKIADFNPVLVISKYTPTTKKQPHIPEPGFPETTWRKGSFKISQDNDTVRLTRVPIQAGYQVIDFGQEHYFKTTRDLQNTSTFSEGTFSGGVILFNTRGAKNKYSQVSTTGKTSKAFVYLQFHIEITVNGKAYLSAPLGRLKMIAQIQPTPRIAYPISSGDIIHYNFVAFGKNTRIFFKHT